MKILKQIDINDKIRLTKFDDNRIQIDLLPMSKEINTIDLSPIEVDELVRFVNTGSWYGMTENGIKPLYHH